MGKKPIRELIAAAARGEPLDVEERRRLQAALGGSSRRRVELAAQQALGAELGLLRRELAALAPPAEEALLAAAFRRQQAGRRRARSGLYAGIAATAALALFGAAAVFRGGERPLPAVEPLAAAPQPTSPQSPAVFRALPYAPALLAGGSYSVVRVRLPLSSLTASFSPADAAAAVEADLLIGEDGLVSGIRFAAAPASPMPPISVDR